MSAPAPPPAPSVSEPVPLALLPEVAEEHEEHKSPHMEQHEEHQSPDMEEHEEHESPHMEQHEEHQSPHMEEHEEHQSPHMEEHEENQPLHMELDEEEVSDAAAGPAAGPAPLAEAVAEPAAGPPAEPAAAEAGRRRHVVLVSPREHFTPAILQRLAPPGMSFGLDQKAHSFTIKFKIKPREGQVWAAYGPGGSRSKAFQHMSWEEALKQLHQEAWERWDLAKHLPGFELDDPNQAQQPGHVSDSMLAMIREVIAQMPPPTKYPKRP